jgi:hypothetical protein
VRIGGLNGLLNDQVGDDHKRDHIDRKAQCSKPVRRARRDLIHALSAPRSLLGVFLLPSPLVGSFAPVRDLFLCAKHLFVAAIGAGAA